MFCAFQFLFKFKESKKKEREGIVSGSSHFQLFAVSHLFSYFITNPNFTSSSSTSTFFFTPPLPYFLRPLPHSVTFLSFSFLFLYPLCSVFLLSLSSSFPCYFPFLFFPFSFTLFSLSSLFLCHFPLAVTFFSP